MRALDEQWQRQRAAALDPDTPFDFTSLADDSDVVPDTDAILTQGQLIGLLQEHAQSGDTIIAAAGGPPGDLQKVWDATEGRFAHLEFGFSCMGYQLPAALGVRFAEPDPSKRHRRPRRRSGHLHRLQLPARPRRGAGPPADRRGQTRPYHQRACHLLLRVRLGAQGSTVLALQAGPGGSAWTSHW
ncbi:hypothetical protein ACWC2H_05445 [Streptomyces sp. 900105755]